jgi:Rha family phage regulatory protein
MNIFKPNDQFGITEKNGIPVVGSRYIADTFGKRHDNVLQAIAKIECSDEFRLLNFKESCYRNEQGRKQPEYLLTRDGFSILVMGFTGRKAMEFKEAYINAFNQMEAFIHSLFEAKAEFPEFTDAIMQVHEEPKHYHFSNECDMINRIVTGMSAKQYREEHGIEHGKSIRPYLLPQQMEVVRSLQRIDIGLIISVPDFQQRKLLLENQCLRLSQKIIPA